MESNRSASGTWRAPERAPHQHPSSWEAFGGSTPLEMFAKPFPHSSDWTPSPLPRFGTLTSPMYLLGMLSVANNKKSI